jgi:hypothetical protein
MWLFMKQAWGSNVSAVDKQKPEANQNRHIKHPHEPIEQDKTALQIARGVQRLLISMDFRPLLEFTLSTGRRIDVAALDRRGQLLFVEIKSSLADFRADEKWPEYLEFCDQFYFAVGPDFPTHVLPQSWGLIIADRYGGEILRPSPVQKLNGSRRKAVTLEFARASASRLFELGQDP